MGYYVRAFCLKEDIPALSEVLQYVAEQGSTLTISAACNDIGLTSSNWNNVDLLYKPDMLPILVECNHGKVGVDSLMGQEIEEFTELIGSPGLSINKRKVLNHLENTKFVVTCQLPTSDIDDDGHNACSLFLDYFVNFCDAMIQADGEGFYKGNRLILKFS